ncbi:MAG TPA: MBL fold metallo-hydrolase [Dehalococcoidia bacterium]|nr:MBL fold metallo-hydrolase [Dehalococcoidia bacterium]
MTEALEIVFLGTGSPLPSRVRCGAGQVLLCDETRVLLDCGWGVARRLLAARVPPASIDAACFTHMHSDHITDVPDFLITRWTGGATRPLTVYGPEGTRAMIDGFLAALDRDIGYRFAHHGEKLSRDGIRCEVHEVPATADPALVASLAGLQLESFEVDHRPVVPALGYRVRAAGASVVFSGDTTACATLRHAAEGVDLLVCEALNLGMLEQNIAVLKASGNGRVAALLEDVPSYHAPTLAVATLARDAGVKRLVLSHVIPSVPNDGPLLAAFTAGMAEIYPGPISVAQDLQRIGASPTA